ncbi:transcription elongation factor spt5 [Stylonychia lemnae]|uniref:Transcription elongation factor spt5 n=1 Tax=Stylonychia lemnae TaxID=5949 RepID=A0A078ADJ6_STYLE|nr:transcription elongation factor spt5 [Stylonychia lemnae]|eukprot:CDW80320.1 transcription elongation factor spt5 [Stylonychia lemnae]
MKRTNKANKKDKLKFKNEKSYEEEDYDEEEDGSYEEEKDDRKSKLQKRGMKAKGDKRDRKRQRKGISNFLDDQAEEASDDVDEDDDNDEEGERIHKSIHHDAQYYTENQLKQRTHGLDRNFIDSMAERYRDVDEDDDEMDDEIMDDQEYEGRDGLEDKSRLPSVDDPRLWQVRVKRGCEKQATMQLMNKSITYAKQGRHLSILSVTCTDKVEGFIYVEAFKEIHVREAITGLSTILGGKCLLVTKEEMPGIYLNDKPQIDIQQYQWVRIKQGLYMGDLALVEVVMEDKVYLRLIPRIDFSKDQNKNRDNDKKKNRFSSFRFPQRLFNKNLVDLRYVTTGIEKKQIFENKTFDSYKNQLFRNGFLIKAFPLKQLQLDNVRPTVEEVQNFANNMTQIRDDDDNEITGEELIKMTFLMNNNSDVQKGDKIRVIKGDLNGLYGTVVTIENGDVVFKPSMENFDDNLKLNIEYVVKYFEPGDQVKVIDGKFKGETGIVVSLDNKFANLALTQNGREIRILANHLKLKSEIDQSLLACGYVDKKKTNEYSANDLIMYSNKYVGVVLKVEDDYVRVINNEGDLQNIKLLDINKKFDMAKKGSTVDSHRNTLHSDDVVKITSGHNKGRKGVVKFIYKTTLFLWDKEFYQSNGIFVENSRNVVILGDEHLKPNQAGVAVNRRFRDPLIGKDVEITKGEWKGYRGRVCRADDRQAIVELSSKCKQIAIERTLVVEIERGNKNNTRNGMDNNYGGATVYEGGKTPMQYNTPSYYPHSPHWGAANQSPGHGTDYDYNNPGTPYSRPQSEHYQKPMTPRGGYGDHWVKNE